MSEWTVHMSGKRTNFTICELVKGETEEEALANWARRLDYSVKPARKVEVPLHDLQAVLRVVPHSQRYEEHGRLSRLVDDVLSVTNV